MEAEMYRPGLDGVLAGETAVSSVDDGLRYRGYAVEDLAERGTFEQTAWVLWRDRRPTVDEWTAFRRRLAAARTPKMVFEWMERTPRAAHGMDVLRTGASMIGAWDVDPDDDEADEVERGLRQAERLTGQVSEMVAAWRRIGQGLPRLEPDGKRSFAGNLLYLLTGEEPSTEHERAMDASLTLYAEHEFNASTFTARIVASTLSDLHSAVVAAIGALKGPLHGGANEKVLAVLEQVGSPAKAEAWILDVLARKQRVMGFGHRVYKHGDPRAAYLKPWCAKLAAEVGLSDMEQAADVMEQTMLRKTGLLPNLDWPSARLYHYLGLPVECFTPLFVASRVVGWSAHFLEQTQHNRLIRPRSRYIGPSPRNWTPWG